MSLPLSVRLAARCAASLLTLLALATLATLAPVAAAQTATPTFTVTVLTDPATGTAAHCTNQAAPGATPDANCALRDALAAVDALGYLGLTSTQPIVNFSSAVIGSGIKTITLASTLVVSHNFNLTGPGINSLLLSGNNAVGILQQANGTSTPSLSSVSGLIFAFGVASQMPSIGQIAGAAWFSADAGVVNFLNVDFVSNNATTSSSTSVIGGTVLAFTANLIGCTFANNTASGSAASLGAILFAETLNISSSSSNSTTFSSNSAPGSSAGVVYANSATIASAIFYNNTAGGEVLFMYGGSIANTVFESNTTTLATLLVEGTTTITNSVFYENAGGIFLFGGSLTFLTSSFVNPLPVSGQTSLGGIVNTSTSGTLTITGSSFADPRTSGQSLLLLYNSGTAIVTNSLFTSGDSDLLFSGGGNLTLTGNTSIGVGLFTDTNGANVTTSLYNDTIEAAVEDISSGGYTATTNAYNTIITGGTGGYGTITDKGGNCIYPSCTALLSALGSYGGPLQTVLPLPSPTGSLIFGGVAANINGATTDARGYPRTYTSGGHTFVDIGATQSNYSLAFVQQPTSSTTGTTITPAPTVQLYESGVAFALSGGNVYVAPSAGTLSGTPTQATNSSGLATFSNLSFAAPENSETLTAYLPIATYISLNATSNPFIIGNKTAQTITFAQPATGVAGGSATLTASSTSGLPITFSVTSGSASLGSTSTSGGISSVTITYLSAAPVTIAANQAGNSTYAAAPTVSRTVTVNAAGATAQTINFPQPRAGVTNGSATLTATSTSGLPVTFSVISGPASVGATTTTGSGPSTVSSATITYINAGSVTIAADQSGNTTYAAAPTVTQTVTVYNNSVWLINKDTTLIKTSTSGTGPVQSGQPIGTSTQGGIAFDANGNSWSLGNGTNTLRMTSSANNASQSFAGSGGISGPTAIAVDGNGYIWIANAGNNSILSFDNSGNQLNANNGYAYGILHNPSAIAVDNTGGLWLTNQMGNSVTRIFGVAAPVATPLSSATGNATLGAKP